MLILEFMQTATLFTRQTGRGRKSSLLLILHNVVTSSSLFTLLFAAAVTEEEDKKLLCNNDAVARASNGRLGGRRRKRRELGDKKVQCLHSWQTEKRWYIGASEWWFQRADHTFAHSNWRNVYLPVKLLPDPKTDLFRVCTLSSSGTAAAAAAATPEILCNM